MTPKETLIRMFAKLDPPTTDLAINLAIGQGFSDDEIEKMKPICKCCLRIHAVVISDGVWLGTFKHVGDPLCFNCNLPF